MELDFSTLAPFTPPEAPPKKKRSLISTILDDRLNVLGLARGQSVVIELDIAPVNGQLIFIKAGAAHLVGVWFNGAALTVGGAYRAGAFELVGVACPLEPFKSGRMGRQ